MYYRYKSKRKNAKTFRYLFFCAIVVGIVYLGYSFKEYIIFWKYSYNKIDQNLKAVDTLNDAEKRKTGLSAIASVVDKYKQDNASPESFFISGRVHFNLGEAHLNNSFSNIIINNQTYNYIIEPFVKEEFFKAIKDIQKGIALLKGSSIEDKYLLILAKSFFYTDYYKIDDIYRLINKKDDFDNVKNPEDIRFYSMINILAGKIDYGINLLSKYGNIAASAEGMLFLASAKSMAKMYTGAIMDYKKVLQMSGDSTIAKSANISLGKIYYSRSLYKESLIHFSDALKIDDKDILSKIWIGKNYSALGDKAKAKAVWAEVLAVDKNNEEAKALLGIM